MLNAKAILVGGILGILSTLAGLSAAKADCSQDDSFSAGASFQRALTDSFRCETNYGEVVKTADGYEAWCVPDDLSEACLEVSSRLDCSVMSEESCDDTMGRMYDACLALVRAVGEDQAVAWPMPASVGR